jgi:hypothetical protein
MQNFEYLRPNFISIIFLCRKTQGTQAIAQPGVRGIQDSVLWEVLPDFAGKGAQEF